MFVMWKLTNEDEQVLSGVLNKERNTKGGEKVVNFMLRFFTKPHTWFLSSDGIEIYTVGKWSKMFNGLCHGYSWYSWLGSKAKFKLLPDKRLMII